MVKSNNDIENQIRKKYQEIELGHSAICDRCKEQYDNLSRPIGLWFVGNRFVDNKYRILFIGKNARGEPGEPDGAFMNQFNFVRNCLWDKKWAYWGYTRAITEKVFGERDDLEEDIAFTNIVKCNISDTIDNTPELLRNNCVNEMKVIQNEIEIINPNIIIMYTANEYDKEMEKIFTLSEVKDTRVKVGKRDMPWREANIVYGNNRNGRLLRVGHPERKKKEGETGFVTLVSTWINNEQP